MSITNIQLVIIGLIIVAILLVIKEQYLTVVAIITLLGGILIPTPLNQTAGAVSDAGQKELD